MSHFIRKCRRCKTIIGQCRCMSNYKHVEWGVCSNCSGITCIKKDDDVKLLFQNPVFDGTTQITVRRGDKWARALADNEFEPGIPVHNVTVSKTKITDGEPSVKLETVAQVPLGYAAVLGVLYCKFDEIPDGLLQHEHDPACRTLPGLFREMQRVYDSSFTADEMVTVIVFRLLSA